MKKGSTYPIPSTPISRPLTFVDPSLLVVIDQIWDTYDTDKSGSLDEQELSKFMRDFMERCTGNQMQFDELTFTEMFNLFDGDRSGTVDRAELISFI